RRSPDHCPPPGTVCLRRAAGPSYPWGEPRLLRYHAAAPGWPPHRRIASGFQARSVRQGRVMRRHVRWFGVLAILAAVASLEARPAFGQAKDDPLIGRWILDRVRSEFSGAPPERRITIFDLTPDGSLKHVTETVIANGSTDRVEYTAKYDGKDNQITNSFLWT